MFIKFIRNGRCLGRRDSDVFVFFLDELMVFMLKFLRFFVVFKWVDRIINIIKNKVIKWRLFNFFDNDEIVVRVGKGKGRLLSVEDFMLKFRNMKYIWEGVFKVDVKV